jgi:hypothetical protein
MNPCKLDRLRSYIWECNMHRRSKAGHHEDKKYSWNLKNDDRSCRLGCRITRVAPNVLTSSRLGRIGHRRCGRWRIRCIRWYYRIWVFSTFSLAKNPGNKRRQYECEETADGDSDYRSCFKSANALMSMRNVECEVLTVNCF